MISVLGFIGVSAVIGVLFFLFGDGTGKTADRLDMLTGRKKKEDEATTILKKDRDRSRQEIAAGSARRPTSPACKS